MKSFKTYLLQERYNTKCETNALARRRLNRVLTREQKKAKAKQTIAFMTALCMVLMAILILLASFTVPTSADTFGDKKAATSYSSANQALFESEDYENEKIEAALIEMGTKIANVTVTHYCTCVECCGKSDGITASGVTATPNVTVAVDPDVIPLGSDVLMDYGDGEIHYYRADDTGGAVKGNHIDLCVSSHEEAIELGVKKATVWWVKHE